MRFVDRKQELAILEQMSYTLDATPDLAGALQNAWNQKLSRSRLFLVLATA